ncbi:MAG: hypothetical protein HC831_06945, partial [Chloroflexia bacterium]|nr:hypothetical protein [Chloroflexia bacterium]
MHTFENGCDLVNDDVDDTPTCDEAAMGCDHPINCNGNRINSENYMDYNTDCYSMFTLGQIDRMTQALDHPARVTLWQTENLEAVGLSGDELPGLAISSRMFSEANGNDGSVATVQNITAINGATFAKTGTLILNTDYTVENLPDGLQLVVEITDNTHAEISFTGLATNHLKENSADNINIVFNQSAITNDLASMLNSAIRNLVINFKDPYRLVYSDTFNEGNDNDIIASNISVWKPFTIQLE